MCHLVRLSHASPFSLLHFPGFIPRQRMEETRAKRVCLQSSCRAWRVLSSMIIQGELDQVLLRPAAWILYIQKDPVGIEIQLTHAYFL
uniref:5-hydroxytryptamine receptor 4 n=1 Tax=Gorilla gorilla gorilla TaxID=9595 RepID=A0A2I2YKT2_GORGO